MSEQNTNAVAEKELLQKEAVGKEIIEKINGLVCETIKRTGFDIPQDQVVGIDLATTISPAEVYRAQITHRDASGLMIKYIGLGGERDVNFMQVEESGDSVTGLQEDITEAFLQDLDKLHGSEAELTLKVPAER